MSGESSVCAARALRAKIDVSLQVCRFVASRMHFIYEHYLIQRGFDSNSGISHAIVMLFEPVEAGMNALYCSLLT